MEEFEYLAQDFPRAPLESRFSGSATIIISAGKS